MNLRINIIFFFLLTSSFAYTQTTTNPFELFPHTKEKNSLRDTTPKNPFELDATPLNAAPVEKAVAHANDTLIAAADTTQQLDSIEIKQDSQRTVANPFTVTPRDRVLQTKEKKSFYPISPNKQRISKETIKKTSLFPIILFNLLFFTVLLTFFRSYVSKIYKAVLNDNMFVQLFNERFNVNFSAAFTPLYLLFIFNLSLFLYLVSIKSNYLLAGNPYTDIGYIFIGLIIVVALQHLFLIFIGNVFSIKTETSKYNFSIIVFSIFTGLILVFLNLILTYSSLGISKWVGYLGFIFITVIYVVRLIRGLFIANKFLVLHKFHFLLYICTLEIAPVLILYRLVTQEIQ